MTGICKFCGAEFSYLGAKKHYCSSVCRKKAWIAKRSKERSERHRHEIRMCECCGKRIEWDSNHSNKRFCSHECKRKHEMHVRFTVGVRKDIMCLGANEVASSLSPSLDGLRESKGSEYFKKLFALPESEQFAEMSAWGKEDHEAAVEYLEANLLVDEKEECRNNDEFLFFNHMISGAFDEENNINGL